MSLVIEEVFVATPVFKLWITTHVAIISIALTANAIETPLNQAIRNKSAPKRSIASSGPSSPRAIRTVRSDVTSPSDTTPAAATTTPVTPSASAAPAATTASGPTSAASAAAANNKCTELQRRITYPDGSTACEDKSFEEQQKITAQERACGSMKNPNDPKRTSTACREYEADKGLNPCAAKEKEAREAYKKFGDACADAGLADVRTCMDEAKACVKSLQENEETATDNDASNDYLRSIGLGNQTTKSQAARLKKCSVYSLKDYETEKRDRQRAYSDSQEKMSKLQEDLAKSQEEFARKKKELQEDFVKAQAENRKEMNEDQKKLAEEGQAAQKQMMEIDQQKADFRVANIKARSSSAKITGERALALAEYSEAMIQTKCSVEVEAFVEKLKGGGLSSGGLNSIGRTKAERQRRVNSVRDLCYAKLRATRASLIKDFRAQLDVVDDTVRENANRIDALENQKAQLSQNSAQAVTRAQQAQQQASNELYQKMQGMQTQLQEMTVAAQKKEMAANQNIQAAQQRVNESLADIQNLGKRPKGQKQPTEAAAQFRTFSSIVKAMTDSESCAPEAAKLEKMIKDAELDGYHKNGLSGDEDDDEDEDTSTSGGPSRR